MKISEKSMLLIFIFICLAIEATGSLFTAMSVKTWYLTLIKPSWTPPNWAFGPVWTLLYFSMAFALWLIWKEDRSRPWLSPPYLLFGIQLLLNLLWSALFFGLQSPFLALINIAVLWAMIAATTVAFYTIHRGAALLLVPYLIWVSYAAALNFMIWWKNF